MHHTRKTPSGDKFEMISGTTGLLGCADGAFVLQKEKRTDNSAVLDIVGRDQPDQKIYLLKDEEHLTWIADRTEKELWKETPDPILDLVANLFSGDNSVWHGSATELVNALNVNINPNTLSKKLNVNNNYLFEKYKIIYENKRSRTGSNITLSLASPHYSDDDGDDSDDKI